MIAPNTLPANRGNQLLASISPCSDEYHLLEVGLSRTRFTAGSFIFGGDDRVLFIEKGVVSPSVITKDGKSLGAPMIGSEGAVGLFGMGAGDCGFQFRALTSVEALQISSRTLSLACSKSRELDSLLHNYSLSLLEGAIQAMVCHFHHELEERLPRWLLMAAERMESNSLLITLEILSEALGIGLSTISSTLETLEERGLIRHARGEVTIINRKRLKTSACRCYPADRGKKYVISTRGL